MPEVDALEELSTLTQAPEPASVSLNARDRKRSNSLSQPYLELDFGDGLGAFIGQFQHNPSSSRAVETICPRPPFSQHNLRLYIALADAEAHRNRQIQVLHFTQASRERNYQ